VLRIDPGLHSALREAARRLGLSLNDFCARKLAAPASNLGGPAADVIRRAASTFGEALVGVVAFGSWARYEHGAASDVDLLVIIEPSVPITRKLYRTWDAEPLQWDTHPVEPHFVHLPEPDTRVTGLWAEAAVDGIVLFDRDLSVSKRLAEIRRRIVAGELVRRHAHGQPYWVGVA
jgi:hypothetical protein